MQNGKNKPKGLGEEDSEVSVQMVKCEKCKNNTSGKNKSVIFCQMFGQYRSLGMERTCDRFIPLHPTNAAARIKAHRERNNLKSFTVELPAELYDGLKHRGESKSAVIVRLVKNQLLRKR